MDTIMALMLTERNEPISVFAEFSGGAVKPVWFSLNGRRIRVGEITLIWKTRKGSTPILHFSVTDGEGLYEIQYNTGTFSWRLAACA
ncbi:MAG TPA: hypothetical protein VL122_10475 [Nitrospirota bacterium]|nr:hypothetical protein [Nitrospirota bacterium]